MRERKPVDERLPLRKIRHMTPLQKLVPASAETRFFALICAFLLVLDSKAEAVEDAKLRSAATRAIQRIQHAQEVFHKKETCTSCHHQLLPQLTLKLARERGVPINETTARETTTAAFTYLKDLDMAVQGYYYIDAPQDALALTAANLAGVRPNLSTAALAQLVASFQHPDGSWTTFDARPPQAHSLFTETAVCAKAIQQYLPAHFKGEQEVRVQNARAWLLKAESRTTEDRVFQLLGLLWTGADVNARQMTAKNLLTEQLQDGGWPQLPGMSSDAYSTGEALFALHEAVALGINGSTYQRGLRFLLENQGPDGTWRIKSRLHPPAPVSPPYFDTQFPEGHDQFISIMGTSWAVNALLEAIPAQRTDQTPPPDVEPLDEGEWARMTLNGTVDELKHLLDTKMKPGAKTRQGTTALMLAARDPEKVRLLLEQGADVNARAETGITALMVAARYRGNAGTVRLLLHAGAKANAEAKVRNDASALFFSVMAGDTETTGLLIEAGARLGEKMKLLGQFPATPLIIAAANDDPPMVELLLEKGANPDEMDDDRLSALSWAVIGNHPKPMEALLKRGANVNHLDNMGMTPVLYAASVDFGDTAALEKLVAGGADLTIKDKQGRTALALAENYGYTRAASVLKRRTAN